MAGVMPKRWQRSRRVPQTLPAGAVFVGRPGKWGNPFKIGDVGVESAERAVELFRYCVEVGAPLVPTVDEIRGELAGTDLVCWCKPGAACHGDVLIEIANRP